MADLKISQLSDGGASQAADEYVVARSGNNFRIDGASVAAAATSVGTLTSLTASGNITTSGRFTSSSTAFVPTTSSWTNAAFKGTGDYGGALALVDGTAGFGVWAQNSGASLIFGQGATSGGLTNLMTLTSSGALTVSGDLTVDTSTLKVDSANNRVGIGTASPTVPLDVYKDAYPEIRTRSASYTNTFGIDTVGGFGVLGSVTNNAFAFVTNNTERMRLDASGNLGLGVTPSAWASTINALQMGTASFAASKSGNTAAGSMYVNSFFDGTNFKYVANDFATRYASFSGQHVWYNAASGTAGNNISFTQAMTLDASGNLGVGVTSPAAVFNGTGGIDVNGMLVTRGALAVNQTNAGVLQYLSDVTTLRSFGATAGSGILVFRTGGGGGSADTERARFTAGGYFKASPNGTYNNATGTYHELVSTSDNTGTLIVKHTGTSGAQYGITITTVNDQNDATRYFWSGEGAGVERGTLRSNGGLANYSANNVNLASDFRLKKDIAPLASTWDKLKAIEVVNFRYKDCNEDDPALYGVIAQQVQPIVPELVVVTREAVEAKDAVLDEDGNEVTPAVEAAPEYYGIREQPMYWLAIKALQEAQARIEALEARLEALEA
jgi:hypothetical protein